MNRVGVTLTGCALLFGGASFLLPVDWEVRRTLAVAAGPHEVYREVADLRAWDTWSAWRSADDPSLVHTYGGALMGRGATATWSGDRLPTTTTTVTEADPLRGVTVDVEQAGTRWTCRMDWTGDTPSTTLVWRCWGTGGRDPLARWRQLRLRRVLDAELETGLQGLRDAVEAMHQASEQDRAAHPRPPRPHEPPPLP